MSHRWLHLALPSLGAVLLALLYLQLGASVSAAMLTVENLAAFALATVGCGLAALAFGRRDYLRTAWGLMGLCYGLLFVDTLLFGAAASSVPRELTSAQAALSGTLTTFANVSTVLGLVLVARAWHVAGLDLQVSRTVFWGSIVAVVVLALSVLGPLMLASVQELLEGKVDSLYLLASAVGDTVATAVLVPLLLTALSLRGGSLAWPWGLLTIGTVLWLGVDAIGVLTNLAGTDPVKMLPLEEAFRVGACLFQVSAGLAQRKAVKSIT
ncbi:MAG: hypothetical protein ACOZQL_15670 [Myxococcota bacterium]